MINIKCIGQEARTGSHMNIGSGQNKQEKVVICELVVFSVFKQSFLTGTPFESLKVPLYA